MNITIKDDTIAGKTNNTFSISIDKKFCTVKELIRERIETEVKIYNERLPEYFNSLVQPTDAEVTLNGYKLKDKRKVDPEKQFYLALDAFSKNGFFLLVNDRQVDSLEEQVELVDNMEISFVKLTPLVGG